MIVSPTLYFYPRSPCGERPTRTPNLTTIGQFLSTLSLRRATYRLPLCTPPILISIHALLAESDRGANGCISARNPISIHALLAESDPVPRRGTGAYHRISIHALLAESDETLVILPKQLNNFYPRSPCGERLNSDG